MVYIYVLELYKRQKIVQTHKLSFIIITIYMFYLYNFDITMCIQIVGSIIKKCHCILSCNDIEKYSSTIAYLYIESYAKENRIKKFTWC